MQYLIPYLEVFVSVIIFIIGWFVLSVLFRTVVETNKVHIVQRRGRTTSYGVKQPNGNVYFAWPSFLPVIGVNRIILPINNFSVNLDAYDGYDKDRVPFLVHITAFFRIDNPALAAERVAQFSTLEGELKQIVQGAARRVLASHDINEIMIDRSKFGDMFTQEVAGDLINWGIVPVKNMELMDIQDAHGSKVIANIMAKKASHIEMESRTEVASNRQKAETAEIEAGRMIGQRTAEKDQLVGIAQQQALQQVKIEEAITRAKEMEVIKVGQVQQAEIDKAAAIVVAEQQKQIAILTAEGKLEAAKREAEGVKINGEADGAAQQAILMAPVNAQIALADKIENSAAYQSYLIAIEAIKAHLGVGTAQAQALTAADIKVIANTGSVTAGVTNAMQLFSGKGGLEIGSMLEALGATPQGKELLNAIKTRFASVDSEDKSK